MEACLCSTCYAALSGHVCHVRAWGWHLGLLPYDIEHTVLQCLLVLAQPVLLPGKVQYLRVHVVSLEAFVEKADTIFIIWVFIKLETSTILHVLFKFDWVALTKLLKRSLQLLLLDILVLLVFVLSWKVLPWKRASEEIKNNVTNSFEIVPPRLLLTHMRCQTCIPSSSCQIFTFDKWDVLALRILKALGKSKINNVNVVFRKLGSTNQEIVRLNIPMDDSLLMHFLNSLYHLL
jgi:hypothetical protein